MTDFERLDREYAYDGELGAIYSPEGTTFRLWSPLAECVTLNLYKSGDTKPYSQAEMNRTGGVWSAYISGDIDGIYYTYTITHGGISQETADIYAKAACANGVRGMAVDLRRTDPPDWESESPIKLDDPVDAVIYELHVRDFSADESSGAVHKGKFAAFCEKGTANRFGERTGLEYIAGLGATHIHLLPVFDFATVDECDPESGYNWGYDPLNYNTPEGSYSCSPDDGASRIREFKRLVQAAHSAGLGVIMDVVYNHVYCAESSAFERTAPSYYFRHNDDGTLSNGSGCGNEFASERAMASKFICDSLCFWAEEYKLDGFRFDLMGLLDTDTLSRCAERLRAINPSILLYGEGWTGGCSPLAEDRRGEKRNISKLSGYAVFSDDLRDGVKGSVFDDTDCGFVNGVTTKEFTELIKSVMCGGIYREDIGREERQIWSQKPQHSVNYVEAHDNLTLYDKLKCSMPEADEDRIKAADRLAAALVFFSQGIPFMQAGQEFLRSKPDGSGGYVHDSYNSPDSVNSLKWDNVTLRRDMVEYYRGLIAIRKRFPQLRLRTAEDIRNKISFEDICEGAFVMRCGSLRLLVNASGQTVQYHAGGRAAVYADSTNASSQPLYHTDGTLCASPVSVVLAELCAESPNTVPQ